LNYSKVQTGKKNPDTIRHIDFVQFAKHKYPSKK